MTHCPTQIVSIFFVLLTVAVKGQDCDKLIHYRDAELLEQFDAAKKKYEREYKLFNDAIADTRKYKDELLSEKGWDEFLSTRVAMSETGAMTAKIALVVKSYCDLLNGLLEMMPGEGTAVTTAKKVKLTAEQTYKLLKTGKDLKEIVAGNLEMVGYKAVMDEMNIGGKAIKTALEFQESMAKLMEVDEQQEGLKNAVQDVLGMANAAIEKYKQKLERNKVNLDEKVAIEKGITAYLTEHCKIAIAKKKPVKVPQKEILATAKTHAINDKANAGKEFYFFLTVSIAIKPKASQFSSLQTPKTLYIISKPFPHNGSPGDDMQIEKDLFLADIKKHFINDPELSKEADNKPIEIHFGKPYDTEVSKTSAEALTAIEAFKNSIKETYEGLAPYDFLSF